MNFYREAVTKFQAGDNKGAQAMLTELLNQDFDNPVLLFALGMTCVAQRKNGLAHSLLQRALERMPDSHDAYIRLGIFPQEISAKDRKRFVLKQTAEALNGLALTYRYEDRLPEARSVFERALRLSPNDTDVFCNIGTMYVNDGRPQSGIPWLEKALAIEPDHTEARWNLSLLQLELGKFREGWPNYEKGARARSTRTYTYPDGTSIPEWDGTPGLKILTYGEQGVGDEIMFASCVPDLMRVSREVVIDCHPRLVELFSRSFKVQCYGTRKQEWIDWPLEHKFDARVSLGSLPKHFRNEITDFPGIPYLQAGRSATIDALPGIKVGISWVGGAKETRRALRSIPLLDWKPILDKNNTLISLQYTDQSEEISLVEELIRKPIHQLPEIDGRADYDRTAEAVNSCDLIITVNTSLVHLAGALGKPCWVLTPSRPAWRYGLHGTGMPWYKSVLQFRQRAGEPWSTVIREVAAKL